jgi:SAM-dependent methyltransferase
MAIGADFTRSLLIEAGIGPGMRVLDAGCGAGDVSFELARLVGKDGSVLGIDLNEIALQAARTTARELGLAHLEFASADLPALPSGVGTFDAIVGRRVLMYIPDPLAAVAALATALRPGGTMAFHEHDLSPLPNVANMPVHEVAMRWVKETVLREGATQDMGFRLYGVLAAAGLVVRGVRVAANIDTPAQPYPLAELVALMKPRILAQGVADEAEIELDSLAGRLEAERARGAWLADLMFGAWATKPS